VTPQGERKDLWMILHEVFMASGYHFMGAPALSRLAKLLDLIGYKLGLRYPLSFRPRLLMRIMLLAGKVSRRKLRGSRQGLLLGELHTGSFFKKRILTPDGLADLAPPDFIAQRPILEEFFHQEKAYAGFKLIGQRQRHTHNSWFHNVQSFMEKEQTNRAIIHPADAVRLSISDGDEIVVQSATGSIRLPARLSDEVMPGVIAIPHGWGHREPSGLTVARTFPGVNVNILTPSGPGTIESLSGMARLSGIRITVAKS
jgi:formate dehydrogenase